MPTVLRAVLIVLGAAVAAIVVVEVVHAIVRRFGRRSVLLADLARTAHRPFLVTVTLFAVQQAVRSGAGEFPGRSGVLHALVIGVIAAGAWLFAALVLVLEDVSLARWRTDVPDNMRARRLRTQVVMLRRVTVAAIVVLTLGVVLMTFPAVRTVGASVLASAGIISVVAALAAQSMLANLFAGLQLAFSDAVRIDDVVVVENEWGRIEELTLSYVVVQIWDDRRLILPTSYFTTKPFQNWTRTGSAVLGTAEIDVDWSAPVEPLRAELRLVCENSDLWDGRVCVLQVTEALGGLVRLRALVSAHDAGTLWDLRCIVRERLVAWVWEHRREALPRWRADVADGAGATAPTAAGAPTAASAAGGGGTPAAGDGPVPPVVVRQATRAGEMAPEDARVFGGSDDGDARSAAFVGRNETTVTLRRQKDDAED
ncbi:MAG TPA: mechanosensitive ion channel domain-containing protein [Actinoplanes sp.]